MEGRFQKHFVHQEFVREAEKDGPASPLGYAHVAFRWIVRHSRSCPFHDPGAGDVCAEEPSEDPSSASDEDE
eukprot:g32877.t1